MEPNGNPGLARPRLLRRKRSRQPGLASGANDALHFGRNEGLLQVFNEWVDSQLVSEAG